MESLKILPGETIVWREGEEKRENGKIVVDNKIGNGAEIFITRSRIIFDRNLFFFFFLFDRVVSVILVYRRKKKKKKKWRSASKLGQTWSQRVGEVWKFDDITHRNYEMPWRISASCIGFRKRHALPLFSLPFFLSFSRGNSKVWEILDASGRASGRLLTRG